MLPLLSLAVVLLGALGVGDTALAATPVGSQFQVNTYTTDDQGFPSVAVDADGDFVVVWSSLGSAGSDSSSYSIQGRRYDASGNATGSEFQVNSYTTSSQLDPSVAIDADGDFVVVWAVPEIQGQRYDASGNAVGSEFQVNSYTISHQDRPRVAVAADGNFVVVWSSGGSAGSDSSSYSIQGQRYDASGNAVGSQFQVNTYTTNSQWLPSVAVDADGDFVVAWSSYGSSGSDSSSFSIQGQRYDTNGNAVGSQFQVNTYTTSDQFFPSVAADADGDFVVVWSSMGSADSDSSGYSIQGQRYEASGSAVGSQFQVNTYTTGQQDVPSVAVDADGRFVVVWTSGGSAGSDSSSYSIQGQRYGASGNPVDSEFQVNSYTTSYQLYPSAAVDADGNLVVVWASDGSAGTDDWDYSIQGQRYTGPAPRVPSLGPPGVLGLALLLLGIAAVGLRVGLRERA